MAKRRPARSYEIAANRAAFAGARMMLEKNISQEDARKQAGGANRHHVGNAMLVLQHGTEEEISDAENGAMPLDPLARRIRERTTPNERAAKRRAPTRTAKMVAAQEIDAEVWGKLRTALDALTSMPLPKDTAVIVRKNAMRYEHANRKLLASLTWLTEFSDEITK